MQADERLGKLAACHTIPPGRMIGSVPHLAERVCSFKALENDQVTCLQFFLLEKLESASPYLPASVPNYCRAILL